MKSLSLALALAALASAPRAQDVCAGNGLGSAYLTHGPARVGAVLALELGSPAAPGGTAFLVVSSAPTPSVDATLGLLCLDLSSPFLTAFTVPLDGSGRAFVPFAAPPAVPLHGGSVYSPDRPFAGLQPPSMYALAAVPERALISVSKTVRITWEYVDGFRRVGSLGQARANHTATAFHAGDPRSNRTRVLVAGGGGGNLLEPTASASTEIYDTLDRGFTPGPSMLRTRAFHTATQLPDGRILIAGGVDSGGVARSSCELWDPATNAFGFTGSLSSPRLAHQATLLGNGRVLVTGGLSDYVDANDRFNTVLNSAQTSADLYDPSTGLWTPTANAMGSKRSGHRHTLLPNGRVLITGGIAGGVPSTFGGDVPLYTNKVDLFDPGTNLFAATTPMNQAKGFHGTAVLPSGDVLVTGGAISDTIFGTALATLACERFDGTTWSVPALLPEAVAFHSQGISTQNGDAILIGGFIGSFPNFLTTARVGRHDGTTYTGKPFLGQNPGIPSARARPRGLHTVTRLYDGTFLIVGGSDLVTPFADCYLYVD